MIDNKQHIGFRVDETSMQGIYDLVTPTAVKEPIRTDLERNVRYFAVSQDDQPDISLQNAFLQIKEIVEREVTNNDPTGNWSIYIRFHLFDAKDKFRKTPRYATLEIVLNTLEFRQRMFTRNSSERFDYSLTDVSEFEEAFKKNIGWDYDRQQRQIALDNEE